MPVKSLNSSVIKWPDRETIESSVRKWAENVVKHRGDIIRIGYFGSFARGNYGVGSDIDIVIVVEREETPFVSRPSKWDTTSLPVPADLLVYTEDEWIKMAQRRMFNTIVWVFESK